MALNYFIGWSIEDLLSKRRELQDALASTHTQVNSEGTDGTIDRMDNLQSKLLMIAEALYAIDPETYPLTDSVRITRTKAVLSGCLTSDQELVP